MRLSLLRGGPNRDARLGLNTLFVCFTDGVRPVFKVYGRFEQCQAMLSECPTEKDVGLGAMEVMYVMMPPECCEPVDWSACEEGCSERA